MNVCTFHGHASPWTALVWVLVGGTAYSTVQFHQSFALRPFPVWWWAEVCSHTEGAGVRITLKPWTRRTRRESRWHPPSYPTRSPGFAFLMKIVMKGNKGSIGENSAAVVSSGCASERERFALWMNKEFSKHLGIRWENLTLFRYWKYVLGPAPVDNQQAKCSIKQCSPLLSHLLLRAVNWSRSFWGEEREGDR